jgi:hypothetical protein
MRKLRKGVLQNVLASYILQHVKIADKVMQEARRELASAGGKARAKKFSKSVLKKWARLGGRPRKKRGKK